MIKLPSAMSLACLLLAVTPLKLQEGPQIWKETSARCVELGGTDTYLARIWVRDARGKGAVRTMQRQSSDPGTVETTLVDGAPHIRLRGECDVATAPALLGEVASLVDRGHTRLVFDLQQVTFLDSSILRTFLTARRDLQPTGGEVILLCRPGFVRRLLSLLELDRLVRVCTPEEWRKSVAAVN